MLEPPPDVTDADVLALVREHWTPEADAVEHLRVGWGAHHWRVDTAGSPALFATLDPDLPRHTRESLEAAYASAAALDLGFVTLTGSGQTASRTVDGGPGPSIIDLPAPGCWSLNLSWGDHHDHLRLEYASG